MDGSTPVAKREGLVRKFNTDDSIFLMLLTTQTGSDAVYTFTESLMRLLGGVGISLVAANRVVLTDTSWNPQVDNQVRLKNALRRLISLYYRHGNVLGESDKSEV